MATALRIEHQEQQDTESKPTPTVFRLNGRPFRQATSTSSVQDVFVTRRLRSSKIATTATTLPSDDESLNSVDDATLAAVFEDAIWAAFESGVMYEILGGLLVEEGTTWTKAIALETAATIQELTDPAEKDAIFEFAAEILLDFFMRAARSRRTSLRSSMQSTHPDQPAAADPASGDVAQSQTSTASAATSPTTTASGTPSSESAPDGT